MPGTKTDDEAAAQYVVDRVQDGHRVRISEAMAAFRAGIVYARRNAREGEPVEWDQLLEWARRVDERDLPDAARHWAMDDSERSPMPTNKGEWQASIEMAFAAGMRWQETREK